MKSFIYVGFIIIVVVACKKATQDDALDFDSDSDSLSLKELDNQQLAITPIKSGKDSGKWSVTCKLTKKTEIATSDEIMTKDFCGTISLTGGWGYVDKEESKGILALKLLEEKELTECKTSLMIGKELRELKGGKKYDLTKTSNYSVIHNKFALETRKALKNASTKIISFCKNATVTYNNVDKTQIKNLNTKPKVDILNRESDTSVTDTKTESDNNSKYSIILLKGKPYQCKKEDSVYVGVEPKSVSNKKIQIIAMPVQNEHGKRPINENVVTRVNDDEQHLMFHYVSTPTEKDAIDTACYIANNSDRQFGAILGQMFRDAVGKTKSDDYKISLENEAKRDKNK